ncbi:MAG TPA: Rieske (2Fe-2S) protein, partial [Pseudonocardiaceae bacterium]|nr:Rieske (2Fe-2S) protein [Pseudonocardiaceae bacterium]
MSARGARRFIADLLQGRRPRPFRADEADAGQLRAAITLRAGQPDSAVPREEFVTDLHRRLAAELARDPTPAPPAGAQPRPAVDGTRRRLVQATSIAAAAAAVGAVTDHALTSRNSAPAGSGGEQTLIPT